MTQADGDVVDPIALRDLLRRVGSSLLEVGVATEEVLDRPVHGLQLVDPLADVPTGEGLLLLAVGVRPASDAATRIVARGMHAGATAVVFHAHTPIPDGLARTAAPGIAILQARPDVGWDHLLSILRRGLKSRGDEELGGVPVGDLFGFANALAARIDGAVTVEDPRSRVLAYSTLHDDLDEPRKETILGRQVPDRYNRRIGDVLRTLQVSDRIVDVPADPEVGRRRRLAVAIRAAGESIGSIWVADVGRPFSADARDMLREASQTAALHFIRHTTDLRHDATVKDGLVRQLLEGSSTADVVAIHLGLEPTSPLVVIAFEAAGEAPTVARLRQAISLYCSAFRYDVPIVDRGPRVYLLLPARSGVTPEVRRFAGDAADRAAHALGTRVLAGVGTLAEHAGVVPTSRADADRALRVLLRHPEDHGSTAWLPDVLAHATLLELLDIMRERTHLQRSPIDALRQDPRNALFVDAIRSYLEHFGDVRSASGALRIHPNTFRYRLKRAVQLSGLDLNDPVQRLVVALQLQLDTPAPLSGRPAPPTG